MQFGVEITNKQFFNENTFQHLKNIFEMLFNFAVKMVKKILILGTTFLYELCNLELKSQIKKFSIKTHSNTYKIFLKCFLILQSKSVCTWCINVEPKNEVLS